jgi:CRP-like cAMP-binding protein
VSAETGAVIIREGDRGDCYYAIADGELSVSECGREINRVRRGDGVGEIALIRDTPRTATVTAATHAELYALDKEPFLLAVTGHATAALSCERVVDERLARSAISSSSIDP